MSGDGRNTPAAETRPLYFYLFFFLHCFYFAIDFCVMCALFAAILTLVFSFRARCGLAATLLCGRSNVVVDAIVPCRGNGGTFPTRRKSGSNVRWVESTVVRLYTYICFLRFLCNMFCAKEIRGNFNDWMITQIMSITWIPHILLFDYISFAFLFFEFITFSANCFSCVKH